MKRIIAYTVILIIALASIQLRKMYITKNRSAEVVTLYSIQDKEGIPVNVAIAKKTDIPLYAIFPAKKIDEKSFEGHIPFEMVQYIKNGQKVTSICADKKLNGIISHIAKDRNYKTGLYPVTIQMQSQCSVLEIEFAKKIYKNNYLISQNALFQYNDRPHIYKIDKNNHAKISEISILDRGIDFIVPKAGIDTGDKIVVEGKEELRDGVLVKIVEQI